MAEISLRQRFVYFCRYYKNRIKVLTIALMTLILTMEGSRVYAVFDTVEPVTMDEPGALLGMVFDLIDGIFDTSTLDSVSDLVSISVSESSAFICGQDVNGVVPVLQAVNNISMNCAMIILIITFCIGLMSAFMHQQAYQEVLVKRVIGLVIGIFFIVEAAPVCYFIANCGTEIAGAVVENMTSGGNTGAVIEELKLSMIDQINPDYNPPGGVFGNFGYYLSYMAGNRIGKPMTYCLQLFIPWITMKAVWVVVKLSCWSRGIETIILASMAPIACSNVSAPHGGGLGQSQRFIKNIAAVSIQGAVIMVSLYVGSVLQLSVIEASLSVSDMASVFSSVWDVVAIGLAIAGLATRSLAVSQKLVGLA